MKPEQALATMVALMVAGCHDWFDGVLPYVCEAAGDPAQGLPELLSETGLFEGDGFETVMPDVMAYTPRFELWADSATKQRWLWLPPGSSIDTSDPDDWVFPIGTKAWKEFSRGGQRIETRLLQKFGEGEWGAVSYVWEGADALRTPSGFVDARGTSHDVPAASECLVCHNGRRSFLLGVSLVQLNDAEDSGETNIGALAAAFSTPLPDIRVPGNATARSALGYLHANCGHCHSSGAPADPPCFEPDNHLDFWLHSERLSTVEATPTYQSAVGEVIVPGDPGASTIFDTLSTRDLFDRMPPLGSKEVDEEGIALISRFIEALR
jgi:hypothetical protein